MWPGCAKVSEKGWSAEDWRRAAWPEFLQGLHGGFGDSPSFTQSLVPGLHSASFTVTVREEVAQPEMHAAKPAVAAQPVRVPTVDSVEFNSYIQPEINIFLMRNQLYTWSRDVAGARELLENSASASQVRAMRSFYLPDNPEQRPGSGSWTAPRSGPSSYCPPAMIPIFLKK